MDNPQYPLYNKIQRHVWPPPPPPISSIPIHHCNSDNGIWHVVALLSRHVIMLLAGHATMLLAGHVIVLMVGHAVIVLVGHVIMLLAGLVIMLLAGRSSFVAFRNSHRVDKNILPPSLPFSAYITTVVSSNASSNSESGCSRHSVEHKGGAF